MKKYLFIVLLVWFLSCEDEPKDCVGVSGGNNICGCMDSLATNFDNTATFDDGSCEFMWGDVNHDGALTIQDLILIVNEILNF